MPVVDRRNVIEPGLIPRVTASHGADFASAVDPRAPGANDRAWTVLSTRNGSIRYTSTELRAQFFDAYGRQRELALDLRHRPAGESFDAPRLCALTVYVHPYRGARGHDPIILPRARSRRIFDRIITLATSYPILLMNDDREGRTRGTWQGLVSFMDDVVNGADPSVRLLP